VYSQPHNCLHVAPIQHSTVLQSPAIVGACAGTTPNTACPAGESHPTPWPCPDHPPCPSTSRRPIQGGSACATVAAAVSVISSLSSAKSAHWSSPVQGNRQGRVTNKRGRLASDTTWAVCFSATQSERNRQSHWCYVIVKRAGLGHQARPKRAAVKSQPSARQSVQHVRRSLPERIRETREVRASAHGPTLLNCTQRWLSKPIDGFPCNHELAFDLLVISTHLQAGVSGASMPISIPVHHTHTHIHTHTTP